MFSSALKKLSFSRNIEIARPDHIFIVRGRDASGRSAWYYIQVDKGKRDKFKAQAGVPFLKLTDYGHILQSGFGENPPSSVVQMMEEEYDFKE